MREVFVQGLQGVILVGKGRGPKSAVHQFKWEEELPGDPPKVVISPVPCPR